MHRIVKLRRADLFAGLTVLATVAGFGVSAGFAQSASTPAPSVTVTLPPQQRAAKPTPPPAPAKKEASVAPKSQTATPKDDNAKVKNLPTTHVVGGRMINPYSEMPETKYIKIPVSSKGCAHARAPGKPYFVEFRARNAASFGHTFVLYGKLGSGNRFASYKVAGLHPKGGPTQYTIGMWIPVPAETGPSDGDIDEQFLEARYCVTLTEAEYKKTAAYIRHLQATHSTWHGTTYNCNSFGMDIAKFIGLDAPNPNMHLPKDLIELLAKDNKNRPRGAMASLPGGSAAR